MANSDDLECSWVLNWRGQGAKTAVNLPRSRHGNIADFSPGERTPERCQHVLDASGGQCMHGFNDGTWIRTHKQILKNGSDHNDVAHQVRTICNHRSPRYIEGAVCGVAPCFGLTIFGEGSPRQRITSALLGWWLRRPSSCKV